MENPATLASFGLAFVAGLLSFLSPCILPVMPAYLSLVSGVSFEALRDESSFDAALRRRVLFTSGAFVLGFSSVFIALGASATFAGQLLRSFSIEIFGVSLGLAQLAGLAIVAMGLHLAGWLPIPALYRTQQLRVEPTRAGLASAFAVGAAFALGWSPCVGPILGGILAVAGSQETVVRGVALLATYSAGLAIPFLLSGWSVELLLRVSVGMRRHFRWVERGAGLLLVAIGLVIVSNRYILLNAWANESLSFLADWLSQAEHSLLR